MSSQNFYLLLDRMNKNDEAEELSEEDFNELIGTVKGKIDGIKDFLSRCEFEQKRLDETYIKPVQARKRAIKNSADRLKRWAVTSMVDNDMVVLHGDLFTIRLGETKSAECSEVDINPTMYLKNKDLIKRKYEFDKTAIAKQLKQGITFTFAKLVTNKHVKFSVKKGENKK